MADKLVVHFFTVAGDGLPFGREQLAGMRGVGFEWRWHLIGEEGEALAAVAAEEPGRVVVHRKRGGAGVLNEILAEVGRECLVWEVGEDEVWAGEQLKAGWRLFSERAGKTAAYYWCWYFVGPGRVISTRHCYGNDGGAEWLRTWRWRPGMRWVGNGTPVLMEEVAGGEWRAVHSVDPLTHGETEAAGLVFQKYGLASEEGVRREERARGLSGVVERWRAFQRVEQLPAKLRAFLPWVGDETEVDRAEYYVARQLVELPAVVQQEAGGAGDPLPVHFFTIVLNGEPFVRYHVDQFKDLPFEWHWHIVEGVASLTHDTAWAVPLGGKVVGSMHREGRSVDGTSEYLDELEARYPRNVTVYRKPPGVFWDGKREMVSAPLANIGGEALLWELDVDEFWTAKQLIDGRELFLRHPDRTAAFYWCWYFVGPRLLTADRNGFANNPAMEWLRTWRYRPGMVWAAHEPPVLAEAMGGGRFRDVARVNPFMHAETEAAGLVFQHFSYVTLEQLRFKELYYGYQNTTWGWLMLQSVTQFPVPLRNFFPWVRDGTMIERAEKMGVEPIWEAAGVFEGCPVLEWEAVGAIRGSDSRPRP